MPNTYVTADEQYGQRNIIELCDRPYASLDEMDEDFITRWNDTVKDDDIVYVLGDLTIDSQWAHGLELMKRKRGRKRFISGNHDKCWSGHRTAHKYQRYYFEAGFEMVADFGRLTLPGVKGFEARNVLLSHFPYDKDHYGKPERYTQYRLRDEGKTLLHGHVHNEYTVRRSEVTNAVTVNVGVDVWDYTPVDTRVVSALVRDVEAGVKECF